MAPFIADLEEAQLVTQRTLDRVRKKSRLLHPVILDDFGLQQAVAWYLDEFARQHGIDTRFEPDGDLAGLPASVRHAPLSHRPGIADQRGPPRRSVTGRRAPGARCGRDRAERRRRRQGPPSWPRRAAPATGQAASAYQHAERAALMGGRFEAGRGPRGGLHVVVWVPLAPTVMAAPGAEPGAEPGPDPCRGRSRLTYG